MKNLILILTLFFTSVVFGDTKISQLPVGTASTVNSSDSFPYVDSVHGITKRILLGDIQNLPTLQGAFLLTQPIPANYVLAGPTSGADASPTSRLLVGADLPNPGASSKGGVKSYSAVTHQWISQIGTDGSITSSQPAFTDISGTAQPSQGGTGQTSLANAYTALYETIATVVGDLVYGGTSGAPTRLAGNTTTTAKFLSQTGTGSVSQAPSWIQPACSNLSNAAASCSTDTTNASNISSGTLGAARLPNPTASTLGGIESYVAVSHQWINAISTSGVPASTQPAFTDISGTAVETQGGTNQTTYTLGDVLYASTANTLSKLAGNTTSTKKFFTQTGTGSVSAAPSWVQPACGDLSNAAASCSTDATNASNISSGTLGAARLPNPSATTLGGIESLAAVSHKWINTISTSGVPAATQPACADISDASAACTVDTTNATNISSGTLSNSRLASQVVLTNQANTYSAGPQSLGTQTLTVEIANDTSTGTTVNKLAKYSSGKAIKSGTGDLVGNLGIVVSGAGTSGSAEIATQGIAGCVFDGATTQGDFVQASFTTAGNCTDAGATYPAYHQVLGIVMSTNGAGGTYNVLLLGLAKYGDITAASVTGNGNGQILYSASSAVPPGYSANPVLGSTGTTGSLGLTGLTSGTVTIKPQSAAGTWEFDLPTTAGSAGTVLTSQGGAGTAMTWSSVLTNPAANAFETVYQNAGNTALTNLAANTTTTKKFMSMTGTGSAGQAPVWATLVGGDTLGQGTMTTFTANGTFTTPSTSSSTTIYKYLIIGAGGGGGGANGSGATGGGGGGGAIAIGTFTGVAASTGITITVSSSGGSAGSTSGGNGGAGGGTTIGSPVSVTAGGGAGGNGSTTSSFKAGGAGGTITAGSPSFSAAGGAGNGGSAGGIGGQGAHSMFGVGGQGGVAGQGGGVSGSGYGAGGGGGLATTAGGGAGSPGVAIIWQVTP